MGTKVVRVMSLASHNSFKKNPSVSQSESVYLEVL